MTNKTYKYKHVLLVDDSDLDNFINERIIGSARFCRNVYVSTSSKSALEFLNNIELTGNISTDIYPEVIFIDINMPGINGFQFLEAILKMENSNMKKCKLAILTSSVHPSDQEKAKNISKDITFITKPLTVDILNEM
jgi:CheY-like chemotaxis protein